MKLLSTDQVTKLNHGPTRKLDTKISRCHTMLKTK